MAVLGAQLRPRGSCGRADVNEPVSLDVPMPAGVPCCMRSLVVAAIVLRVDAALHGSVPRAAGRRAYVARKWFRNARAPNGRPVTSRNRGTQSNVDPSANQFVVSHGPTDRLGHSGVPSSRQIASIT